MLSNLWWLFCEYYDVQNLLLGMLKLYIFPAPGDPPKDIVYKNLTSTSIMLFWSPPQKPNGNIRYYSVYFRNDSGIFIQVNFFSYSSVV